MAAYRSRYADEEKPIPRNDAYTGLLSISFFAMLIGCLLLLVDYMSYDGMTPPRVKDKLAPLKGDGKKGEAPPPAKKEEAKKEEPKKEEAKKQDAKKEEAKKEEAKKEEKMDEKK